jgi:hypothetical protein
MLSSEHREALNRILPLLRHAYWTDGRADLPLSVLTAEEERLLPDLVTMGCLQDGADGHLYDAMPWGDIERLIMQTGRQDEALDRATLRPYLHQIALNLDEADKLLLLSSLGLVERKEDGVAGARSRLEREMGAALSFIEERDALQVRYGVFEPFMTIRDFVLDYPLPRDPLYVTQRILLWNLYQENHILLLQTGQDSRLWRVRSRTAEIVRLLAYLRKRQAAANRKAYLDTRLVRDVRWEMRRRTVPERDIPFERLLVNVINDTLDPQRTSWDDPAWHKVHDLYLDVMAARYSTVSQFQERSIRHIFSLLRQQTSDPRGVVITTATGSGKTLAFSAPMLLQALLEKAVARRPGVKAMCIYPRQKLAENQLAEFVRLMQRMNKALRHLGMPTLTIGIDYQGTPYNLDSFKPPQQPRDGQMMKGKYNRFWTWHAGGGAWRCPYTDCPACGQPLLFRKDGERTWLECFACGEQIDYILTTRDAQRAAPPDVLIITTESINRRLSDPAFQGLFGDETFTIPGLVMLDEIHLYTGVNGAQVALLVRRLLQRLHLAAETLGRQEAPVVVGLSATIREPVHHLCRLTGLPAQSVLHEQVDPATDRTRQVGADHYIFVRPDREEPQPLSTLARAAQCLAHNMHQPAGNDQAFTVLGFVDSLDIVGRWGRLMDHIEQKENFAFRDPEQIRTSGALLTYAQRPAANCNECFQKPQAPNSECSLFQIGECWWFMRQGGRLAPLQVQSVRSGVPMLPGYDMTIATSVLEVGYDDADIMSVIQYMAPQNVASFVQRKGRGGRGPSDRPISLTVINPNHANDVHLYRHAHVLIDPLYSKLPLNVENEEVLKVHGIMSFFDYVAFQLRRQPGSPSPWYAKRNVLPHYQRILASEWAGFERTYLRPLVGNNQRILDRVRGRVRDFAHALEQRGRASLSIDLAHELPRNLFSSINLPEVDALDADSRDRSYSMEKLAIDHAMRELVPGRVTYRFGRQHHQAYWVPPTPPGEEAEEGRCSIEALYKLSDEPAERIDWRLVPGSLAPLHFNRTQGSQSPGTLPLYRPLAAYLHRFAHDEGEKSHWDNWFYCDRCRGFFRRNQLKEHSGHAPARLGDGSGGYPIGFLQVNADSRLLNPDTVFYGGSDLFAQGYWFGPFARLINSLAFFNRNAGEYLHVHKVNLGSEVWARFVDRPSKSWTYSFALKGDDAALGYTMHTEGVTLRLADTEFLSPEDLPPGLRQRLRAAAFAFDILSASKRPDAPRLLPAASLVEALLIWYDELDQEEFARQLRSDRSTLREKLETVFKRLPERFPIQHQEAVLDTLEDDRFWHSIVLPAFERRLAQPDLSAERLFVNDVFFHSFKHTLRDAVATELGAESGINLGGWWHASYDFPNMGDRREMTLFEFGLYGIGYMRDWFNKFPIIPQAVWNALEERMGHCPTGDEEVFLQEVLRLPLDRLERLADQVHLIRAAPSFRDRQDAVSALDDFMRDEYGLELSESLRRLLVRLFGEPLELEPGQVIEDWRLYRDLNVDLLNSLSSLVHQPSIEELEGRAYKLLNTCPDQMPAWNQLKSYLETILPPPQVVRRLRSEMGKRFLTTCVDGCPDCLHGACELEVALERSSLLLSRHVLAVAIDKLRGPLTVVLADQATEVQVAELRDRLEHNGVAYLVYKWADTARVARLTSILLSEPIELGERQFGVQINGTAYERIDLANRDVRYRLALRCYPLE